MRRCSIRELLVPGPTAAVTVNFQGLVNVSRQYTLTVTSDRRGRAPSCYVDPRQAIDKPAACDELRPGQVTDQLI